MLNEILAEGGVCDYSQPDAGQRTSSPTCSEEIGSVGARSGHGRRPEPVRECGLATIA